MSSLRGVATMRIVRMAGLAAFALFLLIPANGLLHSSSTSMEETSILQYASLAVDGQVPTKDFWTEYGPLNVYAPAAVFTVTGPSLTVERVVGLVYRAIFLLSIFLIVRRYSRAAAYLGVALAWWMLAPWGAMAYAWIAGMGLGLAALATLVTGESEPSPRRLGAASVLAGLALSFRPDLIVALGLAVGILVWPQRRQWKPIIGGLAVGLLPYVVLVATAGIPNVMRNLIIDPLIHLRDGRALPFPPSWRWNGEFFSRVQQYVDAMTQRNWYGAPLVVQIAELFWLLVVLAGILLATTWTIRHSDRRFLAVSLFALLLATNIYQRADISHMRLVGSLWLAFTPVALLILSRRWFQREHRVMVLGSATVATLLVIVAPEIMVASMYELSTQRTSLSSSPLTLEAHGRTIITSGSQEFNEMRQALSMIDRNSRPGDRFIQGPSDFRLTNYNEPAYYWLNPQLKPGTYYLEMNPGITNAKGSRMAADITSADILLLSNRFDKFSEPNTSTVPGDGAANQAVAQNFCVADLSNWYWLLRRVDPLRPISSETSKKTAIKVGPNYLPLCPGTTVTPAS